MCRPAFWIKPSQCHFFWSFFIDLAKTGAHTLFAEGLFSCNSFTVLGKSVFTEEEGKGCNAPVSIFGQVRAHNVPAPSHLYGAFLYTSTQGLHPSLVEVLLKAYFENIFNVIESKTDLRRKKGKNGKIFFLSCNGPDSA